MELRDRLRLINGGRAPAPPPVRRHAGIETVLAGAEIETLHGPTFAVEHRFALTHHHGWPIGALASRSVGSLAELLGDGRLGELDPTRTVVLDTETTGLAGGTGTYTFLVGLGLIEADAFVVRQFFLRGLTEERAMLTALADQLAGRGGLITYNGRSFDWPLLMTRFTLARQRQALPELPHWDVLPMARRLWRARHGSCSLGALETSVLGQPRHDDTPGWLIPQLYFDYLRDGDARRLIGVFEHNRRDILALAALAGLICQAVAEPFTAPVDHGLEFAALARLAEERGQISQALSLYRHALTRTLDPPDQEMIQRSFTLLLRRERRWDEAVAIWQAMTAAPLTDPAFPVIELAKYHEHVSRDIERAITLVERLVVSSQLTNSLHLQPELHHRLTRLLTKRRRAPAAS